MGGWYRRAASMLLLCVSVCACVASSSSPATPCGTGHSRPLLWVGRSCLCPRHTALSLILLGFSSKSFQENPYHRLRQWTLCRPCAQEGDRAPGEWDLFCPPRLCNSEGSVCPWKDGICGGCRTWTLHREDPQGHTAQSVLTRL